MSLTLYYHPLASYCHKVLVALYEHEIAFEARIIDLGAEADRAELGVLWPFCKFPLLRYPDGMGTVRGPSIIIECVDPFAARPPLIPQDANDALQVRLWDRIVDSYVHEPMQDIVLDHLRGAKGDTTTLRATIQTAYSLIDTQVATRPWMAGQTFSMADCAAAPALFYAHTLESFPEPLVHLRAYFERLMERPSVQRVLEEARPYFPMYPFHSAIPALFL